MGSVSDCIWKYAHVCCSQEDITHKHHNYVYGRVRVIDDRNRKVLIGMRCLGSIVCCETYHFFLVREFAILIIIHSEQQSERACEKKNGHHRSSRSYLIRKHPFEFIDIYTKNICAICRECWLNAVTSLVRAYPIIFEWKIITIDERKSDKNPMRQHEHTDTRRPTNFRSTIAVPHRIKPHHRLETHILDGRPIEKKTHTDNKYNKPMSAIYHIYVVHHTRFITDWADVRENGTETPTTSHCALRYTEKWSLYGLASHRARFVGWINRDAMLREKYAPVAAISCSVFVCVYAFGGRINFGTNNRGRTANGARLTLDVRRLDTANMAGHKLNKIPIRRSVVLPRRRRQRRRQRRNIKTHD